MAKASDNLFPYLHLVPAAAPAAPAAGAERLFLDSADGNKLKRKNSAGTVATVEGGGGGSGLLATMSYNPATATTTGVSTTEADVDATNLKITFTAPASGSVLIHCGVLTVCASGQSLALTLREGTTQRAIKRLANGVAQMWSTPAFLITGLTSGTSYTYKLGAVATGASGCSIGYGGTTGTASASLGAATMAVWSA